MNKFFAKTAKREGFTLVELIVVIAILGILAGIAIPVYSGYISKANEAKDVQLVAQINTAIAAAAAGNGLDAEDVLADGDVTISGGTATIAVSYAADTTIQTRVQNDLGTYLGQSYGASGVAVGGFQHYTKLTAADGQFTGSAN